VRRSLAALLVVGLLLHGLPARADDEPASGGGGLSVAVLDSIIDGVPASARPAFEQNLEDSLRGAGFTVLPKATVKGLLLKSDAPPGCSFGPCLRAVGKALDVELALVVRISADGPSFTFVLTLVDTQSGAPVAQVSDTCAVCTFDEASSAATLAIVDLGMRYRENTEAAGLAEDAAARKRKREGRHLSTWVMAGMTVLASGAAVYLLVARDDADAAGWAAVGGAAGLAVGTVFTF
jgi:hypothetical protein